jgi:hypothetical protein
MSTFTPQNDIILKLKDRFLAFDQHGNQLTINVNKAVEEEEIIKNYEIMQCQIVERKSLTFLAFVFE